MSKTVIYFLRHGEVYNPQNILYGRLPGFRLSEEGKKRIKEVALFFRQKKVKYIYTSPMLRARQTAKIIGEVLGIVPKVSYLINEVHLIFNGIPLTLYRKEIQYHLYDKKYIKRGQESIESIAKRMVKFLRIIVKRHHGKTILVVSHGDPIVILKAETQVVLFTWNYKKENYLKTGEWFKLVKV